MASYNRVLKLVSEGEFGEPVRDQLEVVEQELNRDLHLFNYEVRYRRETPTLVKVLPLILSNLNALREEVPTLYDDLASNRLEMFKKRLEGRLRRRVTKLYRAFQELRDEDEAQEKYCDSPAFDQLLRNGVQYLDGELSGELLQERVRLLLAAQQRFLSDFTTLSPEPGEAEVVADQGDTLRGALEMILNALLELDEELDQEEPEPEVIEELLGAVEEAVTLCLEIKDELGDASRRARQTVCVRCGEANRLGLQTCQKCGAALPRYSTESLGAGPEVDLRIDETIESAQPGGGPEIFERLMSVIEAVSLNELPRADLEAEFESTVVRFRSIQRQMERMPAPDSRVPPETAKQIEMVHHQMSQLLEQFGEGLSQIENFLESEQPAYLQAALRELRPSGEGLTQLLLQLQKTQNPSS